MIHDELLNFVIENISQIPYWIVGVVGAIGGWIWKFRPRTNEHKILTRYVDDMYGTSIEQHEYTFSWGLVFFLRKISLTELPFGALIDLTVEPPDLIEVKVPKGAYEEKAKKNSRKIIIKNKKYFQDQHVDKVRLLITRQIPHDYRNNIKNTIFENYIEIKNNNSFEIKNYQMNLSKEIDLLKIKNAPSLLEGIRFDISIPLLDKLANEKLSNLNTKEIPTTLMINSLPAKKGREIENVRIQLN